MAITLRLATTDDIADVLTLHRRYQLNTIAENDKTDGFITTAFDDKQLSELITKESGLFLAFSDTQLIGYAMAASWDYWSQWPMFAHMIQDLPKLKYQGIPLSTINSYQYGPICVDKSARGSGVFEALFEFALTEMAKQFRVLVTFINKINTRSFAAHTNKVQLDILQEFEYNNNHYYEMVCLTH